MNRTDRTSKRKAGKGEAGYIDGQKKRRLCRTLLYCAVGVAIFVLGLCLNKFEKSNIFTVIAVLMVLPAAKALVSLIVLLPFCSVEAAKEEQVRGLISGNDVMYADMVFSSPDKIMFLSFLVIAEDEIIGLSGRKKEDIAYMERYLRDELKKRMLPGKLYITGDEEKFLRRVEHAAAAEEVPEELTDFLKSLMV